MRRSMVLVAGAVLAACSSAGGEADAPVSTTSSDAPIALVGQDDAETVCERFLPIFMDYDAEQISLGATYGALRVLRGVYPTSGLAALESVVDGAISASDVAALVQQCEQQSSVDFPRR